MSERISFFDMFKIGVGPSSSHTLGPWRAAMRFMQEIPSIQDISSIQVLLYGSLAKTGVGHGTDIAIQMGLMGHDPETVDTTQINAIIDEVKDKKILPIHPSYSIAFHPDENIDFLKNASLPFHPNAMTLIAGMKDNSQFAKTYYSIGGGFIVEEGEGENSVEHVSLPYPIDTAEELIKHCTENQMSIAEVVWNNEKVWRPTKEIREGVLNIWQTMRECIVRGCFKEGILPGGLGVVRRAPILFKQLTKNHYFSDYESWLHEVKSSSKGFNEILDWINCFALAVNEENASFGRVVTAPTNGAAGVIPAVLQYYIAFYKEVDDEKIIQFLLTAAEFGSIFKKGATISAAMGGCQAEIGVSSAMAAGALTECLGGSVRQAVMAAEIAMEHHLGMTCDPVGGLVQIPCIERNTMGAIKAITACRLALSGNPTHAKVSLDHVINSMWETALDMNSKYKETSDGGLATQVPLSLSEC